MNDKKKLLFTVTDGIADEYLMEAAATRLIFPAHTIKRIAAVAAMIAIFLTCLFWNPATESPAPALAIRVFAAENDEQTVIVGSPPVPIDSVFSTAMCEHSFPENYDFDGFFFRICKAETFPQKYFSEVEVEYNGGSIHIGNIPTLPFVNVREYTMTEDGEIILMVPGGYKVQPQDTPSCLNVIAISGEETIAVFSVEKLLHPEDTHLCVHGNLKETTDMKIKLYVTQNGERKLYQSVTVRINVEETGYTLEVLDITVHEQ